MTTPVDTNVFVVLWDEDALVSAPAQTALDNAFLHGNLIISAPVFCELMAGPSRTETFLDTFFHNTGIAVDFELDMAIWRLAASGDTGSSGIASADFKMEGFAWRPRSWMGAALSWPAILTRMAGRTSSSTPEIR